MTQLACQARWLKLARDGRGPEANREMSVYCPLQTTGTRRYDYPLAPWGSTTKSVGNSSEFYIRTGYLYIPYGDIHSNGAGPTYHPGKLDKADPTMVLASEDLLTPTSPHGFYWNIGRFDGSVKPTAGDQYLGFLLPDQSLSNDWNGFKGFRDRLANP